MSAAELPEWPENQGDDGLASNADWAWSKRNYERARAEAAIARLKVAVEALRPYAGDPNCRHDKLVYNHAGRRDHNIRAYDSCGECGADLALATALAAIGPLPDNA